VLFRSYEAETENEEHDFNELVASQQKFLKTATFKILSPFSAELFSESDSEDNCKSGVSKITEKEEDNDENGTYSVQQLRNHYENFLKKPESDADDAEEKGSKKKQQQDSAKSAYSKSFDMSLSELDERIDRINNEIKLKKKSSDESVSIVANTVKTVKATSEDTLTHDEAKNNKLSDKNMKEKSHKEDASTSFSFYVTESAAAEQTKVAQEQMNARIVETLKSEVSQAFSRLELEYKLKLDEQHHQGEIKMKQMYDEIRESIRDKEKDKPISPVKDIDNYSVSSSTIVNSNTIDETSSSVLKSDENLVKDSENAEIRPEMRGSYKRTQSVKSDSQKQLTNLRMSLKTKHSRHIQDLKTYYEQEIDELRNELQKTQNKFDSLSAMNNQSLGNFNKKVDNNAELQRLIEEMKKQNLTLLQRTYESDQHTEQLRHENYELKSQLNKMNTEHFLKEENKKKLENTIKQMELELDEINKSQEIQIRDLQNEKRNHAKKVQEYEELKRLFKATEGKIDDFELKLNEKETENCSLKTKITKLEADLSRIGHEYQKMRTKFLTHDSNILAQDTDRTRRYSSTNMIAMNGSSPLYNTNNLTSPSISSMKSTSGNLKYPSAAPYSASQSQLYDTSPTLLKKFESHQELNSHSEFNVNDDGIPHYESPSAHLGQFNTTTATNNIYQAEKHLEYIAHLEENFDHLIMRKQQLEAQLTRLPHKATNTSMHVVKQSLENDVSSVEKQLASVKLELRKLSIIKTSH